MNKIRKLKVLTATVTSLFVIGFINYGAIGVHANTSPAPQSGNTTEEAEIPKRKVGNEGEIYSKIINPGIIVLSAAVVLAIIGSIVVAGIQYSTANGNSSAVAAAKNRIFVSVVVLILYIFGFAILQWLIPGGIGT